MRNAILSLAGAVCMLAAVPAVSSAAVIGPAGAVPAVVDGTGGGARLVPVREGCGRGFHRDWHGYCRPNHRYRHHWRRWHHRYHCWTEWTRFGWRRVCR